MRGALAGAFCFMGRLVLVSLLTAGLVFAESQSSGFVLTMKGGWKGGDGRPLASGKPVKAGETLTADSPGAISLALYDGTHPHCSGCQKLLINPEAPRGEFWSMLKNRLQNQDRPPISFVTSRGVGPTPPVKLKDAIVTVSGTSLDLSPVLSAAPAGGLTIVMTPLEAAAHCPTLTFKMTELSQFTVVEKACPALYELASTDESMEAAYPATVLLVPRPKAAEANRLLAQAEQIAAGWNDATEDERRRFMRVSLSAIGDRLLR